MNEYNADLDKELSREHLLENAREVEEETKKVRDEDELREYQREWDERSRVAHEDQVLVELSER